MASWRQALQACAALAMVALGAPAHAQDVKLGVLTDLGGPYADSSGPGAVEATKMAVEDMKVALGAHHVEVVSADHLSKPDVGAAIARRWLDTEHVDSIVNVPNSAIALAVQTVTRERKKIFLITGGATVDLTGKQCSPYAAHWTDDTYSLSTGTTRAMMERGGAKSWFLITADYAAGYGLAAAARRVIEEGGGKVVGEARHPFGTSDQTSFLLQAQSSGAQMIALANAGTDTINSIKQAHEFHIGPPAQTIVAMALFITDADIVMAWMKSHPLDDFYAPGAMLRADGRLLHPVFLAQVKTPAEFHYPWDYYKIIATIPPERAFRPLAEGGCPFIKP